MTFLVIEVRFLTGTGSRVRLWQGAFFCLTVN